jgi:hypothetical protein
MLMESQNHLNGRNSIRLSSFFKGIKQSVTKKTALDAETFHKQAQTVSLGETLLGTELGSGMEWGSKEKTQVLAGGDAAWWVGAHGWGLRTLRLESFQNKSNHRNTLEGSKLSPDSHPFKPTFL